jgi:hypothetical protein
LGTVLDVKDLKKHLVDTAMPNNDLWFDVGMHQSPLPKLKEVMGTVAHTSIAERVAKNTGKSIEQVTDLEIVTLSLQDREAFVEKLDLSTTPLFSSKAALASFQAEKQARLAAGVGNAEKVALEERERQLKRYVDNEEIMELEVDEDVFQWVKENTFPALLKKGVTAEEVVNFLTGGSDASKALEVQYRAADSIGKKLGRRAKVGDIFPEKRLQAFAEHAESTHPFLQADRKVFIYGEFNNLPQASTHGKAELEADPAQIKNTAAGIAESFKNLEFTPTDFNPPTHFRPIPEKVMAEREDIRKFAHKSLLNFANFEGPDAARPANSAEQVIMMKLWKLFHITYPYLNTKVKQDSFLEQFDVSPGERTLDWTLSFPPPDHTFIEVPIIKEAPDEVHGAISETSDEHVAWPRHRPWFERYYDAKIQTEGSRDEGNLKINVSDISTFASRIRLVGIC